MRVAALALLSAVLFAGCASGPSASWELVEWGEAKSELAATKTIAVAPFMFESQPVAGEARSADWATKWPAAFAQRMSAGIEDNDGPRLGVGTGLGVRVSEFYNGAEGHGGSWVWGHSGNPQAKIAGTATFTGASGRTIATLRFTATTQKYGADGAGLGLCYDLGERFADWLDDQR